MTEPRLETTEYDHPTNLVDYLRWKRNLDNDSWVVMTEWGNRLVDRIAALENAVAELQEERE